MDKKLIVSRNMNRELKNTTKKYRSKDCGNERYSTSAVNVKQYHVPNNNFHRTLPKNYHNKSHNAYLSDAVSLSNEEYIHANSQIWLNEKCLKSNFDYNDIYSQWESIIQINFYTNEEIVCPICLDTPTVCRTDKCGHIYCYSCLNKFLSYQNGFYKKCALCNQEIDPKRVKRASFIPRFSLKVKDTISMLLMKRNKIESFPVPINYNHTGLPYVYTNESRFSNVVVCSNEELQSILQLEIMAIEDELVEAIREQSDQTISLNDALESLKNELKIASIIPLTNKLKNTDLLTLEIDTLKTIMRSDNVYYQAEDGSNVFMCPLNWKCMTHEFIDNNDCLPLRLSGQILEIERFTITPEFINRYRYLKYLPIGSSVSFVDIDLSEIVSDSTLNRFDKEIQRKNDDRFYKEKLDAQLTTEKIKHENSFHVNNGFVCLNSLMKETNNLLDEDFVPLCSPLTISPVETSVKSNKDKPLSFADMIHAKKIQDVSQSLLSRHQESAIETQTRGFSLQDCVVKKARKKAKK